MFHDWSLLVNKFSSRYRQSRLNSRLVTRTRSLFASTWRDLHPLGVRRPTGGVTLYWLGQCQMFVRAPFKLLLKPYQLNIHHWLFCMDAQWVRITINARDLPEGFINWFGTRGQLAANMLHTGKWSAERIYQLRGLIWPLNPLNTCCKVFYSTITIQLLLTRQFQFLTL